MESLQQASAILLVFALLGLLLWLLRRKNGGSPVVRWLQTRKTDSPSRECAVVDRVILTTQHQAHLLQVKNASVLVVTFPGGATCTTIEQSSGFRQVFRDTLTESPSPERPA